MRQDVIARLNRVERMVRRQRVQNRVQKLAAETERPIRTRDRTLDDGWERLDALRKLVDEMIRNRPPN